MSHVARDCRGGEDAHEAHMDLNSECPWEDPPAPTGKTTVADVMGFINLFCDPDLKPDSEWDEKRGVITLCLASGQRFKIRVTEDTH